MSVDTIDIEESVRSVQADLKYLLPGTPINRRFVSAGAFGDDPAALSFVALQGIDQPIFLGLVHVKADDLLVTSTPGLVPALEVHEPHGELLVRRDLVGR